MLGPLTGLFGIGSQLVANGQKKRAAKRANQWNVDQWNRENAYNDPSAQMARLRKAKLNPNMIFGASPASATGNASSVAPANKADVDFNPPNPIAEYQNFTQKEAQTNNTKETKAVIKQEAILKGAQTAKTAAEGKSAATKANLDTAVFETQVDATKANLRQLELSADLKGQTLKHNNQAQLPRLKKMQAEANYAVKNLTTQQLKNELLQLEKELSIMGLDRSSPWYAKITGRIIQELKIKK